MGLIMGVSSWVPFILWCFRVVDGRNDGCLAGVGETARSQGLSCENVKQKLVETGLGSNAEYST